MATSADVGWADCAVRLTFGMNRTSASWAVRAECEGLLRRSSLLTITGEVINWNPLAQASRRVRWMGWLHRVRQGKCRNLRGSRYGS